MAFNPAATGFDPWKTDYTEESQTKQAQNKPNQIGKETKNASRLSGVTRRVLQTGADATQVCGALNGGHVKCETKHGEGFLISQRAL